MCAPLSSRTSCPETYDRPPPGDAISRITTDVEQFSDGLLLGFTQLFTGILTICGTLGVMLFIEWRIALVVVALTPLSICGVLRPGLLDV